MYKKKKNTWGPINFLVSEGLQGTHIGALNPFNSKLMTCALTGFFLLLSHMIYLKLTKVL
jgi:hypothetical protein